MSDRSETRILVIGDSCKDVFVYCDTTRRAPEAPMPVLDVVHTTTNPGMAKNLHRNIKAIHPYCDIATNQNWHRITKTRYVHHETGEGFARVDSPHTIARIDVSILPLHDYDAIAISDYDKGFLHTDDIAFICKQHPLVFVDTKKQLGSWLKHATYIKVNEREFRLASPLPTAIERKVIWTRGQKGAVYQGKRFKAPQVIPRGVSGAGDSFFAALIVHYLHERDIHAAIDFANTKAAEVVTEPGVTILKGKRQARASVPA